MASIKRFEEIIAWQKARILCNEIDMLISNSNLSKDYKLKEQINGSSGSIMDNIAEGFGRYHYQENIQFCRIARGSLNEALNQVITALDDNYIEEDLLQKFRERFERTKAILNGYINYLARTKME